MEVNPLKVLRAKRTIDALAKRAHVNRNLIIRAEQGCYSNPPPVLVNFFIRELPPPLTGPATQKFLADLHDNYHAFQTTTRLANGPSGSEVLSLDFFNSLAVVPPITVNPVTAWREFSDPPISKSKVAISYCIHLDVVQRVENRPHLIPNDLPSQFLASLSEAGYPVGLLNDAYRSYRNVQKELMVGLNRAS